jgi:hypothetical protein
LRSFFGITNAGEQIQKIAILFRNGRGTLVQRNADGTDMYIPVYDNSLQVKITEPFTQPTFIPAVESITKNIGDAITIKAKSSATADMSISFNGSDVFTGECYGCNCQPGDRYGWYPTIVARATSGAQ